MSEVIQPVALAAETRRRYLSYALSVITARALPDVRDGLKPVQRRILYTMGVDQRLGPTARHKKSAKVVGEVMGSYHPHGDQAIYDALVRMAQPFTMRAPLIDGQGNFGSLDGDPPAAYRYTEVRLTPLATELLEELAAETVPLRPNYDDTRREPVVLPARLPHLLLNGAQGIAVGMASSIPPHNLGELVRACVRLIDEPQSTVAQLLRTLKGPDLPTGGELLASREELRAIYESGRGSLKLRGTYRVERSGRRCRLVIDSVPWGGDKSQIVEKIGEIIAARRLPQALDVRDESTEQVRIVLELKPDADPARVMAYLYRHTPLMTALPVNLTCLVPGPDGVRGRPARLDLKAILRHFLDFRLQVLTRRLEHRLRELRARIHILEGFAAIFAELDAALALVRGAEGREDARQRLCARFGLDAEQAEAVLQTRIYRLARLEIARLEQELGDRRAEASRLERLLASEPARWGLVREELEEIARRYADPRRTRIAGGEDSEHAYDADAYVVDEDTHVVLTRDGWIKRVQRLRSPEQTRTREGDEVAWVLAGSTRSAIALFTNHGSAYVLRIHEVPATHGYGEPLQKFFRLGDGERVVGALSLDERLCPPDEPAAAADAPPRPWLVAATARGQVVRLALAPHREVSTRTGRRYLRLGRGDEVVGVALPAPEQRYLALASRQGRVAVFALEEVNVLAGPGKGVRGIKLEAGDRVVAMVLSRGHGDPVRLLTSGGGVRELPVTASSIARRGGRGRPLVRRQQVLGPAPVPLEVPVLAAEPDAERSAGSDGGGGARDDGGEER
ncbi:MAG: DNA topoisomerase (ATP-hydrolyzing) [Planctomycetota bacterium]|nr:MAG: DNA topoisomerase (ATP-hydrolyzing) [Planctomycetota bacterium]